MKFFQNYLSYSRIFYPVCIPHDDFGEDAVDEG